MTDDGPMPSGMERRHAAAGDVDIGEVAIPEVFGLAKTSVSFLDGESIIAWRLTWGDRADEPGGEVPPPDGEVWIADEQMSSLCDLHGQMTGG